MNPGARSRPLHTAGSVPGGRARAHASAAGNAAERRAECRGGVMQAGARRGDAWGVAPRATPAAGSPPAADTRSGSGGGARGRAPPHRGCLLCNMQRRCAGWGLQRTRARRAAGGDAGPRRAMRWTTARAVRLRARDGIGAPPTTLVGLLTSTAMRVRGCVAGAGASFAASFAAGASSSCGAAVLHSASSRDGGACFAAAAPAVRTMAERPRRSCAAAPPPDSPGVSAPPAPSDPLARCRSACAAAACCSRDA